MRLKFWGTRGSIPAPLRPDQIKQKIIAALQAAGQQKVDLTDARAIREFVAGLAPDDSTIGGNTTCVTIELKHDLLIFDAGSGIRELGEYLLNGQDKRARRFGFQQGRGHAHLFFTHTHHDHIQGFPFFKPLHVPGNMVDIYHVHDYVPDVLVRQMAPELFPIQFDQIAASINFHQLTPGEPVWIAEATITHMELDHPGKSYAYRIEADHAVAILATDGEYEHLDYTSTAKYRRFYENADALIFDTMFSEREVFIKESWERGHSSALIGADIAREAQVKRLFLFHSQPFANYNQARQVLQQTKEYLEHSLSPKGKLPEILIAQEGKEIKLANPLPVPAFHVQDYVEHNIIFMALFGKFDAYETEQFKERLNHNLQTYQVNKVILRMEKVEELTMAGIQALVDARKIVISLALVGVTQPVYQVFELARVTDFFAIYDDLETALRALNSSRKNKLLGDN